MEEAGLVYILSGNVCYAMSSSDYTVGQGKPFGPLAKLSLGNRGFGCRGVGGERLTPDNGIVTIYNITKERHSILKDVRNLR